VIGRAATPPGAARIRAGLLAALVALVAAEVVGRWQLLAHALTTPSALVAIAAVVVAAVLVAMIAHTAWLAAPLAAGPLLQRAVALRRKSWGAVYQRQLNPAAAGRARPRAPSAVLAAA
jgi:hypothetical protein